MFSSFNTSSRPHFMPIENATNFSIVLFSGFELLASIARSVSHAFSYILRTVAFSLLVIFVHLPGACTSFLMILFYRVYSLYATLFTLTNCTIFHRSICATYQIKSAPNSKDVRLWDNHGRNGIGQDVLPVTIDNILIQMSQGGWCFGSASRFIT